MLGHKGICFVPCTVKTWTMCHLALCWPFKSQPCLGFHRHPQTVSDSALLEPQSRRRQDGKLAGADIRGNNQAENRQERRYMEHEAPKCPKSQSTCFVWTHLAAFPYRWSEMKQPRSDWLQNC